MFVDMSPVAMRMYRPAYHAHSGWNACEHRSALQYTQHPYAFLHKPHTPFGKGAGGGTGFDAGGSIRGAAAAAGSAPVNGSNGVPKRFALLFGPEPNMLGGNSGEFGLGSGSDDARMIMGGAEDRTVADALNGGELDAG